MSVKVKKVYSRSEEKWMKAYVLYANSDGVLCFDADGEIPASKEFVANAFKKGLLVDAGVSGTFKPTNLVVGDSYATLSLVVMGASAAEVKNFYSDGYTAG